MDVDRHRVDAPAVGDEVEHVARECARPTLRGKEEVERLHALARFSVPHPRNQVGPAVHLEGVGRYAAHHAGTQLLARVRGPCDRRVNRAPCWGGSARRREGGRSRRLPPHGSPTSSAPPGPRPPCRGASPADGPSTARTPPTPAGGWSIRPAFPAPVAGERSPFPRADRACPRWMRAASRGARTSGKRGEDRAGARRPPPRASRERKAGRSDPRRSAGGRAEEIRAVGSCGGDDGDHVGYFPATRCAEAKRNARSVPTGRYWSFVATTTKASCIASSSSELGTPMRERYRASAVRFWSTTARRRRSLSATGGNIAPCTSPKVEGASDTPLV